MNLLNLIKQRRNRTAVVIGVLMLVHLAFFAGPDVGYLFERLWFGLRGLMWGNVSGFLLALAELMCKLAGIVIWVLSVFVAWAVFQKSRKKGYLILLVYFLLPLVVEPLSRLMQEYSFQQQAKALEQLQAAGQLPLPPMDDPNAFAEEQRLIADDQLPFGDVAPPFVVARRKIVFPVGPLLLLLGVWRLGKEEG
jgi:hypothetical protein